MSEAAPKNAPGPRTHVLLGELFYARRDRLGFVSWISREFGDVVRFRMGNRVLHLVNHPDNVRYVLQDNHKNYRKGIGLVQAKRWLGEGLVTSEGEAWLRQRRIIQPAFQRQQMAGFDLVIADATSAMLKRWCAPAEQGRSVDVASDMMQLTLDIFVRAMFSTRITNASEVGASFTTALQDAMDRMTAIVMVPEWLPFPGKLRFKRAIRTLDAIVYAIIESHRKDDTKEKNLLTTLTSESNAARAGPGNRDLRDQIMTLLLAGHETTASSLAWTFFLLSNHPWAWRKMRAEVDRVLGGRTPTQKDLPKLVWTRLVFQEVLRLYPPVWLIPRRAITADKVGGYHIPTDSDVLISPYVIHRDPRYWIRPMDFNPLRFSPENSGEMVRYTYLPFGIGPRACVAQSFAMTEALLILVTVTQKYRLQLVADHEVVPEPLLTLRARHGIAMLPISR